MGLAKSLVGTSFVSLVCACTAQTQASSHWADFWQVAPQRQAETLTQDLVATGLPMSRLGTIRYQQQTYPLPVIKLNRVPKQASICLFAGVHGNEIAGTAAALSLIDDLAHQPQLYPKTNFVIVPLVNPWGWERGFRYNFEGQDIARNFARAGTQETVLIKALLARERCQLVVDLHEDSTKTGFYLLTYAHPDPSFTPSLVEKVAKALGMSSAEQVPQGVYQISAQEFATNPRPTLSQYAREQAVPQTYIIETPMQLPLKERIAIHRRVLDELITHLPTS
ncbi:DUF2817 domain-containing protein [uncultured Thiothrix sp.]|uniref:DUF2817 domain-containing protein n=1 Tax=uncultured Thiothrix sp. TaxID=223185 RepID=UPI0026276A12|nr:DUF2817 domain-containing protein [uncultured Thiothrix sp.]